MKKLLSFILVLMIALSFSGCGKDKKVSAPQKDASAVNVSVHKASKTVIEDNVTYTGEIKASEYTSVSAKASGIAQTIYKEIGDYVEAGDILLEIDDTDYRIQYNQAKAAYDGALAQYNSATNGGAQQTKLQLEASLNAAKIEYNNAKTNFENQKVLYEKGAISKSAYDAAVTRYDNAQINLNTAQSNYDITVGVVLEETKVSAKAGLSSANAALDAASSALSNTVVRAPISGYIASKNANKGQMVSPGVEIFSIKATERVNAQINVTEAVISSVSVGTKASIKVKAASEDTLEGIVTAFNPVKNAQTGMYQINIEIDNFEGLLKDGMFAEVTLTLNESADALVVPSEAVMEKEDGGKYVYIAKKDIAEKKDITVGIINDEYTEVLSGIKDGDRVILSGKEYLSEKNNKIKVVE